eukprot:TRINITY_DN8034_c0_g1_i1.p2 TRINITY_DN8034_c0_g1~~TRINITY_DN8034_c0_g1_i1.p2  ORF type:complete len:173 (-),score=29.12 TRINITY_DN8034_c0_g1_i1:1109-1627(-)
MDWFLGQKAEKEINNIGEAVTSMVNDAQESVTNWWESMLGKVQTPLPDTLSKFEFPAGIFPKNITKYVFRANDSSKPEQGGVLEVYLPAAMEVKFSDGTVLQYAKKISTRVTPKEMAGMVGLKLKGITGYTDVSGISSDPAKDNIHLQARMRKTKPIHLFKSARDGVEVLNV